MVKNKDNSKQSVPAKPKVLQAAPANQNPNPNSNSNRNRFIIACCAVLFFGSIILGLLVVFGIWRFNTSSDSSNKTLDESIKKAESPNKPTQTAQTTQTDQTTATGYGTPQDCSQVEIPASDALSISVDDPGVKKNLGNHYYSIFGYTANDLRNQVINCGPKQDSTNFTGMATSQFDWIYNLHYTDLGACQIISPAVGINVDIYYPSWEVVGDVQPGLSESWQTYMDALTIHEQGHMQRHYDVADQIYNSINGITAATCDEANNTAGSIINNIIAQDGANNVAYDDETNHGATQGAILP